MTGTECAHTWVAEMASSFHFQCSLCGVIGFRKQSIGGVLFEKPQNGKKLSIKPLRCARCKAPAVTRNPRNLCATCKGKARKEAP